jgi:hypothetical protein
MALYENLAGPSLNSPLNLALHLTTVTDFDHKNSHRIIFDVAYNSDITDLYHQYEPNFGPANFLPWLREPSN